MSDFSVQYAFVCDDVRQEANGKMMYIGQMDVIQVPRLPVVLQKLCIVYSVTGPPGPYKVLLTVKSAEGKVVFSVPEHEVFIKNEEHRIREVFQVHNVRFEQEAKYTIDLSYNGENVHSFDIGLVIKAPKAGPGQFSMPVVLSQN